MNDLEKEVDELKGAGETLREGLKLAREEGSKLSCKNERLEEFLPRFLV